jgi:glucose dehydrogenase
VATSKVNRIGNPLYDVLPQKARKIVYAILFVAALVFAIWQASDGNWEIFVGSLLAALVGLLASSNTAVQEP